MEIKGVFPIERVILMRIVLKKNYWELDSKLSGINTFILIKVTLFPLEKNLWFPLYLNLISIGKKSTQDSSLEYNMLNKNTLRY